MLGGKPRLGYSDRASASKQTIGINRTAPTKANSGR